MLAIADFPWSAIIVIALLLAVFCFLAVLWSRREWNTRKIRVGLFLEREYRGDDVPEPGSPPPPPPLPPADDTTAEMWPTRKE